MCYVVESPWKATFIRHAHCVVAGTMMFPQGKTSWAMVQAQMANFKNGGPYFGVASWGIDQSAEEVWEKCGWCMMYPYLRLWSWPPHSFCGKVYGLLGVQVKYWDNKLFRVVVDTVQGVISFETSEKSLGPVYKGVPIVLCMILCNNMSSIRIMSAGTSGNSEGALTSLCPPQDLHVEEARYDSWCCL